MNSVNILTFKWGTLYSAEYVNRVYRGVKAHLKRPFRFVCVTDDPTGLVEGDCLVDRFLSTFEVLLLQATYYAVCLLCDEFKC